MGGSFNPAHHGHLHISLEALKRLHLDEIWWLVSPQNPLKSREDMASLIDRVDSACHIAGAHPKIRVTDLETSLKTRFTADTLEKLHRRFTATRFVWLMGADNLTQIPRWQRWGEIFRTTPIAVFARPTYSLASLRGKAALRFGKRRVAERKSRRLADIAPASWVFFPIRLENISATNLRMQRHHAPEPRSFAITTSTSPAPIGSAENAEALVQTIIHTLDEAKAEDIRVIDLRGKSSIADHLIIATGRSSRQVGALGDYVLDKIKETGHGRANVEGKENGDWVLIDAGDLIVHLFRPEVRAYYNLEKMWGAPPIPGPSFAELD